MAETFNLNMFLQTYKQATYDPTKKYAASEKAMEEKLVLQAEKAVEESGFLTLTLSEKLAELGIGEMVLTQFADTAMGLLTDLINPVTDYLDKYKNIFDQSAYNSEIQAYAKQMFFASQAMEEDAEERIDGRNFTYTM